MDSLEAVEKILNYSFKDKNLLKEAITKTSRNSSESPNVFERLEFFGDSVLGLAIANYIHLTYPNFKLSELQKLFFVNISNETFARVAVNHKLHHCLIFVNPNPYRAQKIKKFSDAVAKEDDPAPLGGLVKAPKILADLVESIAGAVYIDVNFDVQRFWEIFKGLIEPIYTLDDLWQQHHQTFRRLYRLGDKLGKRIDFKSKDREVSEVYLGGKFMGWGRGSQYGKLLAATELLRRLSEHEPIGNIVDEVILEIEIGDVKQKLFEICSTEKLQIQTGSFSLLTTSENPLSYEMTPDNTVMDEDCLHVELEDVKRKLFEICASEEQTESSSLPTASEDPLTYDVTPTKMVFDEDSPHVEPEDVKGEPFKNCSTKKLRSHTESSSLPTTSENLIADEMTHEQMVIDENSPHVEPEDVIGENLITDEMTQEQMVIDESSPLVEPEDAKGKLFKVCSTRKLQIQTGSSSLPTTSVNPLTYEMTIKKLGAGKDSLEVEPNDAKLKLLRMCTENKWPNPIYSVEEERGPKNEPRFVCLVMIEIPTVEGTFHMKGDAKSSKKQAENSSAYHMIRALESSLMSLVISNLQMQESLKSVEAVEKILNYSFTNKNLLREALTHNSFLSPLFQRLIFVGKPALSLAFVKHIYLTYPKLEPEELDLLKRKNICNGRFASVFVKHGIYKFIICNVPKLESEIMKFIELMGKEDDPDSYKILKAPKLLGDLVISVAGAVYFDVNLDVKKLWEVLRSLFEPIYTLDQLRQEPCKSDSETHNTEVYLDDKFIAYGNPEKYLGVAKRKATTVALQKLSEESMPIEMVVNDYIEYEDAEEKLTEICNDRKWTNPVFSIEGSAKRYVCSVKIEIPTEEEETLCIKGDTKRRRKTAKNNAASRMISYLKSSPVSSVIRDLRMQSYLDDKKTPKMQRSLENGKRNSLENGNLQMQNSLDENKNPQMQNSLNSLDENKNLQMQNSLDDNKNDQMQNSLDENKTLQMQNGLDENKTLQMQKGLDENKNLQMQNGLNENKNPQVQNSLDENENLRGKKRKRNRR